MSPRQEKSLSFLNQANILFTNNQAEQDLRMMKCKQWCDPAPFQGARERAPREKIAGCFRCTERAVDFANIRSVLSTARKQNLNLLQVLVDIFSGHLPVFS